MNRAPPLTGALAVLFGLALRLYPRTFRERFGASMREAFDDVVLAASARGRLHRVGAGLRSITSCAAGGLAERVAAMRGSAPRDSSHRPDKDPFVETVLRDLRFAGRSLRRNPVFTLIAVVTLALGIGANTAIFSVVDGVLLRPLQYEDPDGLVMVWGTTSNDPAARGTMSLPDIEDVAALSGFETLVGVAGGDATLTGLGEARLLSGWRVSDGLLTTFRLAPFLGRDITAADGLEGAAPVVVVSHDVWQTLLGGRREALGTMLALDGVAHEIVGVASPGFDYPAGTEVWRARPRHEGCARGCRVLRTIGRLAAGVTVETAHAETAMLATRLTDAYPETNLQYGLHVESLADATVGGVRRGLWVVLGTVIVVLLIACANVANLLVVRASHRQGEVAVRAALGASRLRLTREILSESVLLALAGGAFGVLVAAGLLEALRGIAPPTLPRLDDVALDARVLLFTLVVSASRRTRSSV